MNYPAINYVIVIIMLADIIYAIFIHRQQRKMDHVFLALIKEDRQMQHGFDMRMDKFNQEIKEIVQSTAGSLPAGLEHLQDEVDELRQRAGLK